MSRTFSLFQSVLATVLAVSGCTGTVTDVPLPSQPEIDETGIAEALAAPFDRQWIYNGTLPALESPQLTISIAGHTARVTGLLPATWKRPLPYYAVVQPELGRRRVTIVYPIATADLAGGWRNATEGTYPDLSGPVFTPSGIEGKNTPWGGFPYLEYDHARAIALHGPITHTAGRWQLRRGPVSHGCNRMQGEHVVELAHLLGKDMTRPYDVDDGVRVDAPAGGWVVRVVADFDRVDGKVVDVDYPAWTGFARPTGSNVRVYPTWSTDRFARFVCGYRDDRATGPTHCDAEAPILANPLRLEDLGAIRCPAGYTSQPVGSDGGRICVDGTNALGPFTRGMIDRCRAGGGGPSCDSDRWAMPLALRLRGTAVCPAGALLDYRDTGYCVEGTDAFGPYPTAMVDRCLAAGGGSACTKSRWSYELMRKILHAVRGDR